MAVSLICRDFLGGIKLEACLGFDNYFKLYRRMRFNLKTQWIAQVQISRGSYSNTNNIYFTFHCKSYYFREIPESLRIANKKLGRWPLCRIRLQKSPRNTMRTLTPMTPTKFHLFLRLASINQDSEQGSGRYETKNSPAQNLSSKKFVGIQVLFHLCAGRFVLATIYGGEN